MSMINKNRDPHNLTRGYAAALFLFGCFGNIFAGIALGTSNSLWLLGWAAFMIPPLIIALRA